MMNEDAIHEALDCILDKRNHPVLVHCLKGQNRTGVLLACLRKIQDWSLTAILDEYCTFAPQGTTNLLDWQLIELFDTKAFKIKISSSIYIPEWLN